MPELPPRMRYSKRSSKSLAEPFQTLALPLRDADAQAATLDGLLAHRQALLAAAVRAALDALAGQLYIISPWTAIYLGHGVGRDVGEGARAPVRTRRAWAEICGHGRRGPVPDGRALARLVGPVYRPYRAVGGQVMPVGRLTWPGDAQPALRAGGLALGERLLPLLVL